MNNTLRTRMAGGLTTAAGAAFALTLAAGSATAAGSYASWEFDDKGAMGTWTFTMSVSDPTPNVGDEIIITNSMAHTKIDRYIYKVKQVVPQCLELVDATSSNTIASTDNNTGKADSNVVVNAPGGGWRIAGDSKNPVTVSVTYKVTNACAIGKQQDAVMHISGLGTNIGEQNFDDHPVSFTVSKGSGSIGGGNGGGSGSLDTGSLDAFLP
ncbi:hypothetical protein ACFQNE_13865 [Gordonia phosphorivorans]|uniref:Alternate-type signal peptide domain-containing protein n=1 Tax=Gordonia phosphorivorans TaxID=1056982 RepID=A0ABV6HEG9_9ACTN